MLFMELPSIQARQSLARQPPLMLYSRFHLNPKTLQVCRTRMRRPSGAVAVDPPQPRSCARRAALAPHMGAHHCLKPVVTRRCPGRPWACRMPGNSAAAAAVRCAPGVLPGNEAHDWFRV